MFDAITDPEMLSAMRRGWCFFSKAPSLPEPLPPPTQRTDPAIAASKKRQRQSELLRRGRASTIIAGGRGDLGEAPVARPQARASQLFGG